MSVEPLKTPPDDALEWEALRQAMAASNARLPDPSPLVLQHALARITALSSIHAHNGHRASMPTDGWQAHPLSGLLLLLRRQIPLIGTGIWAASLVVLVMGMILTYLFPYAGGPGADVLALAAPIVAAAGIALIYGPENDPASELEYATPISPALILLARLVLVYGYNLALALATSVLLWLLLGQVALWPLILSWLAPMLFLSALALALSVIWNSQAAIIAAFSLWGVHVFDALRSPLPALADFSSALWSNQMLLVLLALLCLALAFLRTLRQEQRYV
jgi:hypothetical protein